MQVVVTVEPHLGFCTIIICIADNLGKERGSLIGLNIIFTFDGVFLVGLIAIISGHEGDVVGVWKGVCGRSGCEPKAHVYAFGSGILVVGPVESELVSTRTGCRHDELRAGKVLTRYRGTVGVGDTVVAAAVVAQKLVPAYADVIVLTFVEIDFVDRVIVVGDVDIGNCSDISPFIYLIS